MSRTFFVGYTLSVVGHRLMLSPNAGSRATLVHQAKRRSATMRPQSAHASLPTPARPALALDARSNADAGCRPRSLGLDLGSEFRPRGLDLRAVAPPEPLSEPTPRAVEEAVTKPDVDELLGVKLVLGQGMIGFGGSGGRGGKRTSLSDRLEIAQSRARIASLIGQYEEIEMEVEEGAFDEMAKLKDTVMMKLMDIVMKSNKKEAILHAAHSELEEIARWSDEAQDPNADEVAKLDTAAKCVGIERQHGEQLVDRLGRLKEVHGLSIEIPLLFSYHATYLTMLHPLLCHFLLPCYHTPLTMLHPPGARHFR